MTARTFARSIWFGPQYATRSGRTVVLSSPRWIFSCPHCEYRMTATTQEGVRAVRRVHVRTAHPRWTATVDALDDGSLPAHLAKRGHTA